MTTLQAVMDSITYVTSDSLQAFFICNLIILVVLFSSLKTSPDDDQHRIPCTKSYNDWAGEDKVCCDLPGREVSISVKEVAQPDSWQTDEENIGRMEARRIQNQMLVNDKLRLVEVVPLVQRWETDDEIMGMVEVPGANNTLSSYENNLITLEAQRGQIESIRDNDQLRIEGESCYDNCRENNSHEMYDHVEEDDQFRKRVEAFISKVNNGLRDEMMQSTMLALCN